MDTRPITKIYMLIGPLTNEYKENRPITQKYLGHWTHNKQIHDKGPITNKYMTGSTGHVPHTIANIYYPELWLFQRVQTKFRIGTDPGTDPSGMQRRPPFTNMKIQIPVVPQEKIIKI